MFERMWELEGHWTMGRCVPRDLLSTIGAYLRREAPHRRAYVLAVVRRRAEEIAEDDAGLAGDAASEAMVALTSTLLAAHETLLDEFDGDAARTRAFLRHALGTVLRRPLALSFGSLSRRDDPLGAVEDAVRAGVPSDATGFDVRYDRTGDAVEMRVERCFFLDVLARHGVPELTTVLCAWDAQWLRAADPAATRLRTERTSTLARGDDACRFRVVRTDDPQATFADVVPGPSGVPP